MTDGERVQADLESAVRDHEERRGLEQRLRSAEDQLDNIFSDMAVRSRIMEAADRTRQALSALAELDRRRDRLLVG